MTDENKDVQAQENVNKDEQVSEKDTQKSQGTEIDVEQLLQERENYKKAMLSEREKAREKEEKLKTYEQKEKEREEKKKLEEGKYKELLEEKTKLLQDYESQVEELKGFKDEVQKQKDKQIKSLLSEIPDERKDFVNKAIDGKSGSDKVELLKGFKDAFKKPVYSDESAEEKSKETVGTKGNKFTDLEQKVQSGKATPSEKGEYIEMLRKGEF